MHKSLHQGSKFKLGTHARCWIVIGWLLWVYSYSQGWWSTPPTWASHLSKTPVWQVQSCQLRFSRILVWNILSYFLTYVSVSNLHFSQMKLASEKSPEAVLEGVIFLGEYTPRLWRALHAIPHPLWKFGRTGFFLLPMALFLIYFVYTLSSFHSHAYNSTWRCLC